MREEFVICPNIVFRTSLITFEIERGGLVKKTCKGGCSNVSVTKWKIFCFNPGKMDIFRHLVLFPHWSTNTVFSLFAGFMVWGNVFKIRKVLLGYPMHSETN